MSWDQTHLRELAEQARNGILISREPAPAEPAGFAGKPLCLWLLEAASGMEPAASSAEPA
jgi:hypothetical protein